MLVSHRSPSCLLFSSPFPVLPVFFFFRLFLFFSSLCLVERRAWWTVQWPDSHPAATLGQVINETTTQQTDGKNEVKKKKERGFKVTSHQIIENSPLGKKSFFFPSILLLFLLLSFVLLFLQFCTGIQVIAFARSGYRAASGEAQLQGFLLFFLPPGRFRETRRVVLQQCKWWLHHCIRLYIIVETKPPHLTGCRTREREREREKMLLQVESPWASVRGRSFQPINIRKRGGGGSGGSDGASPSFSPLTPPPSVLHSSTASHALKTVGTDRSFTPVVYRILLFSFIHSPSYIFVGLLLIRSRTGTRNTHSHTHTHSRARTIPKPQ